MNIMSSSAGKRVRNIENNIAVSNSIWECTKCTFINHSLLSFCEVCNFNRENTKSKKTEVAKEKLIIIDCDDLEEKLDMGLANSKTNTKHDSAESNLSEDIEDSEGSPDCLILETISNILQADHANFAVCYPYPKHISQKHAYGSNWSCGYRNIQMLSSSLMQIPEYRPLLFDGSGTIPSIFMIQHYLELAWADGFDTEGAQHFNHSLIGKSDWIGTTGNKDQIYIYIYIYMFFFFFSIYYFFQYYY
jgi:hypothetical protein